MGGRRAHIYIMTNGRHGTLYVGVAPDLPARVAQHRGGRVGDFADRYGLNRLVWFETVPTMDVATAREKSLKRWRRDWKIVLIERDNPAWEDLGPAIGLPKLAD